MAVVVTIVGALGKDAEFKTVGSGELCQCPVAGSIGYGDKKQTLWFDVSKWGKGAQGLAGILKKGTKVTVMGELSKREHDGKTYLQCRADLVELQGDAGQRGGDDGWSAPQSGNERYAGNAGNRSANNQQAGSQSYAGNADDFDEIPF